MQEQPEVQVQDALKVLQKQPEVQVQEVLKVLQGFCAGQGNP